MAARVAPALLVVDEGLIEFSDSVSAATVVADQPNLVVLRSLSLAYGLAGARVGAAIAQASTLARLASVLEPYALPEPLVRLAQQALDPSRMIETAERIAIRDGLDEGDQVAVNGQFLLDAAASLADTAQRMRTTPKPAP